jgi:alpha-D-ribose 1-methylphosphonate 5-triphosphate synthase subunit PhnH
MSATIDVSALKPGFSNPVIDSQAAFRAILEAMSFPTRIQTIAAALDPPAPLEPAAAAICLTLMDMDTPVWLDEAADTRPAQDFLRFHCGCSLVDEPAAGQFAVVADPTASPRLGMFAQGSEIYPDQSATVIVQAPSLTAGPKRTARGPGIEDLGTLAVDGLPDRFWHEWKMNHSGFPNGVDILFACGAAVIGLPRSIEVEA